MQTRSGECPQRVLAFLMPSILFETGEIMGLKEQIIFPEISIDKISKIQGMDITFVTSAGTDAEAYELLKAMGMPFASIKK